MCKESHTATNFSLDPDLVERAVAVSGERTKKAAVTRALEEFIARPAIPRDTEDGEGALREKAVSRGMRRQAHFLSLQIKRLPFNIHG
ncbi:MAG: type II toxin-antitoxin system VapB family antitoxin [Betaproteobacteria bacterium]|nr:type II toxin-antitoxin system VapB family antitoxin [Betaproteobacteria bacterium]